MKKAFYLIVLIILFTSCNKNNDVKRQGGNIAINMTYRSGINLKSPGIRGTDVKEGFKKQESQYYTGFGDYITSVTPTAFIAKFLDMRLQNMQAGDTIWNYGLTLIDGNNVLDSPKRLADFSNNATVNFAPDMSKFPSQKNTTFNIFVFIQMFFYQEFELPAQYENITDLRYLYYGNNTINFDGYYIGGTRNGLIMKGNDDPFMTHIFGSLNGDTGNLAGIPHSYAFGGTDSTFIFQSNGKCCINDPLGQGGNIVRSNAYQAISLQSVPEGETRTINGTLTFDTNNLIQIYAGVDNIPYTYDDIFVYAPNFWERMSVNITEN